MIAHAKNSVTFKEALELCQSKYGDALRRLAKIEVGERGDAPD